jgi:hypothetical protein
MRRLTVLALVLMLSSSGCLGFGDGADKNEENIEDIIDEIDNKIDQEKNNTDVSFSEPVLVQVPYEKGCDNINPLHCMLPFPSTAFLREDSNSLTGYRVNYTKTTIPGSGTWKQVEIPGLNRLDGMSPSTQILTAFDDDPVLARVANQSTIGESLMSNHSTVLLNLETGEKNPHWVELDARTDDKGPTILYIRTLRGLEHDTAYGVGIAGLTNESGNLLSASSAFQALIDGNYTDALDVELRSEEFGKLFDSLEQIGYERQNLQAAWKFHTASTESIIGGMLHMREDALIRLGDEGIGCNVTSSEDNFGEDNMTLQPIPSSPRRINASSLICNIPPIMDSVDAV